MNRERQLPAAQPLTVEPRSVKRIIVCADDFAVHESASLGISRLAQLGRISAASVMVLSPRWGRDVALLLPLRGQIDVGLHLDWTSDFARQAGHGQTLYPAMLHALLGGFDPVRASSVVAKQLDLFEAHWQAPPDYIDGHQHVHQFAGIRQALVSELTRRYGHLAVKPYLRVSRYASGSADLKARVIAAMGANALESIADNAGLTSSKVLFGIYDFAGDTARYARLMSHWLARAPAGVILMCHPARASEPADTIGKARAQEFTYLSGTQFAQALQQAGAVPARGLDVLLSASASEHPPLAA
ncbi:hypothetical protein GALL_435890 [mine drainage metagenome]|uniref:ChbG/HpnK family deacetylase n=1 Tax=mine drainage metagenome TaxID=410659 RepID=A0A1J5PV58_9ZZZZ